MINAGGRHYTIGTQSKRERVRGGERERERGEREGGKREERKGKKRIDYPPSRSVIFKME